MEKKLINQSRIDLACGDNKIPGFFGIDIAKTESVDHVMNLQQYPWDIESESADEINCSHYIEHIPHDINNPNDKRDGLIQFMDECYRILKPGGKLLLSAPYYTSMRAYGDPTHTRYMADFSFLYYNKEWRDNNKLSHYGIKCDFDIKYSYHITNEMTLKSEEVRSKAFLHDWNVIDDIIVELIKR